MKFQKNMPAALAAVLALCLVNPLPAAAEVTDCWPVREQHRRSTLPKSSTTTTELAHAV